MHSSLVGVDLRSSRTSDLCMFPGLASCALKTQPYLSGYNHVLLDILCYTCLIPSLVAGITIWSCVLIYVLILVSKSVFKLPLSCIITDICTIKTCSWAQSFMASRLPSYFWRESAVVTELWQRDTESFPMYVNHRVSTLSVLQIKGMHYWHKNPCNSDSLRTFDS